MIIIEDQEFTLKNENAFFLLAPYSSILKAVIYEQWKIGLAKKCAINQKSAIFMQSSWHSFEFAYPWAGHFAKISACLEENCRYFTISKLYGRYISK